MFTVNLLLPPALPFILRPFLKTSKTRKRDGFCAGRFIVESHNKWWVIEISTESFPFAPFFLFGSCSPPAAVPTPARSPSRAQLSLSCQKRNLLSTSSDISGYLRTTDKAFTMGTLRWIFFPSNLPRGGNAGAPHVPSCLEMQGYLAHKKQGF